MNRARRQRGFTLPEVLATLVIIGIILPVAMQGITVASRAAAESRHKLEAAELAQQKIAELLLDSSTGSNTTSSSNGSGDFGTEWPEYKWESQTGDAGLNTTAQVDRLDVTVKWTSQGTERSVTLSTLVYPDAATASSSTTSGGG